jgi:molybdate transport system substrate-binding protein
VQNQPSRSDWRSFATRLAILLFAGMLAACSRGESAPATQSAGSESLNVYAAASLTASFNEGAKLYEAEHAGGKIHHNFAGSQELRNQIEHGAPADVFASANMKEMEALAAAGLVDRNAVTTFAHNRLVVIFPKENQRKVTTLGDLAQPGLKIDVADPAVPVGKYTQQMIDAMSQDAAFGPDFKTRFNANVVSREEHVLAVVT